MAANGVKPVGSDAALSASMSVPFPPDPHCRHSSLFSTPPLSPASAKQCLKYVIRKMCGKRGREPRNSTVSERDVGSNAERARTSPNLPPFPFRAVSPLPGVRRGGKGWPNEFSRRFRRSRPLPGNIPRKVRGVTPKKQHHHFFFLWSLKRFFFCSASCP